MRPLSDEKILNILRCPVCGQRMQTNGVSLTCTGERKHCYDLAASGYVNFCSPTQSGGGDSKQAVRARSEFLDLGYYRPISVALADACAKYAPEGGVLIDAGCGEGYYASELVGRGFSVFGADLSKFAVDAASKRLARLGADSFFFATASVFELPVADGCADAVTNVFAPCAESEYLRVLKGNGILAIAAAGQKHLWGLKSAIYDTARENTERADLPRGMKQIDEVRVTYDIELGSNAEIKSLFAMTPYYWRTSVDDARKLEGLNTLKTQVDVVISVYKKDQND